MEGEESKWESKIKSDKRRESDTERWRKGCYQP